MTDDTPVILGSHTVRIVLLIAWIAVLLIIVAIPTAAVYCLISIGSVPAPLDEWGSISLGFIFGALFAMLKERM